MDLNHFKKITLGMMSLSVMVLSGYSVVADAEVGDGKILSPAFWKPNKTDIKISSENELLSCSWNGNSSGEVSAKDAFDISGMQSLEFGIEWKTKKWDFGSAFYPVLRFEDAQGKKIDTVSAFSQTKGGGNYVSPPAGEFFSGTPADKWILYRNIMKVPEGAVRCRIGLLFSGNPLDCQIKKLYVKDAGTVEGAKFKKPQYDHKAKALTKEEIDKILEKRERASGKIQRNGDQNQMIVNGKVINPFIYKNGPTGGSAASQLARCKTFSDAGFTIFTISIQLGQPSYPKHRCGVWLGDGKYDIKKIEDAVYDILAYAPNAYVFLELGMTPYYEWTVNNPDEIYTNSIGEKGIMKSCRVKQYSTTPPTKEETVFWQPSYFSEKYKDDMTKAISDIFREFEKTQASKAVLGAYLNGGADGQWLDIFEGNIINGKHEVADYSPGALKSFQKYLRKKYSNDVEKLRAEWKKNDVTFETVKMPASDDIWEKKLSHGINQATWQSDFNEWMAAANTERHITWCKTIKDATGGRMLMGAYWPEGGVSGYPIPAHRYSKGIYASDSVDFLSVVLLYGIVRQPAQYPKLYTYNGSMLLHEKLLVVELDLRNDEIPNWGYWGNKFYLETHNATTFSSIVQRTVGYAMGLGGTFHAYDMDGGWWDTPNAIESWKNALKIAANAKPQAWDSNRIAVFMDERTADHLSLDADYRIFAYSLKEHISEALWRSGVGFDYYILEDSLNPKFEAPKVMMFADASTMKPEDAAKIRKKYGNSGRVIVWYWAPGIFAKGDSENPSKITGFKLKQEAAALEKQIFVSEEKDSLTKGISGVINPIPFFGVKLGPSWKVDDPEAKILANYNGTNLPAMAVKRYADHTEIYIGQPGGLTPRLVKNIAKEAGVEPYLDSDKDISRFGAGLLTVSAMAGGEKTVSLSKKGKFNIKCLTGQTFNESGNVMKYFQKPYDTAIFSILDEK